MSDELDEILYNLIMLNKVREASEVDTDEQFLEAKQAIERLIEKEVDKALTEYQNNVVLAPYVDAQDMPRAVKELSSLIRRARVEELTMLHRSQGKDLPKRDYDNETDELIDERIEHLNQTSEGEA